MKSLIFILKSHTRSRYHFCLYLEIACFFRTFALITTLTNVFKDNSYPCFKIVGIRPVDISLKFLKIRFVALAKVPPVEKYIF